MNAWVEMKIAQIDEYAFYASIGAYDPEAFKGYLVLERDRLTHIDVGCNEETRWYRDREIAGFIGKLAAENKRLLEMLKEKEYETPEFAAFERKGRQMSGDSYDDCPSPPEIQAMEEAAWEARTERANR